MNEKQNQPAELRIINQELGLFVITGMLSEMEDQADRLEGYQMVRPGTMDRFLAGGRVRRIGHLVI